MNISNACGTKRVVQRSVRVVTNRCEVVAVVIAVATDDDLAVGLNAHRQTEIAAAADGCVDHAVAATEGGVERSVGVVSQEIEIDRSTGISPACD